MPINKKRFFAVVLFLFGAATMLLVYKKRLIFQYVAPIDWANEISTDTVNHGWGTWKTYYSDRNPAITHELFMCAIKNGEYKTLSVEEFLALKVENQRLERYLYAKTAEEAYPPEDRPRHSDDISSVNYFLQTGFCVSPILVARIHENHSIHYIKLDGVHRLIASAIKKSPIKILFIDLLK